MRKILSDFITQSESFKRKVPGMIGIAGSVFLAVSLNANAEGSLLPNSGAVSNVAQQSSKLKGIVSDSFGPVAGASVIIKGTTNGIMTDADGAYSLDGIKKGDVIVFSYIGYIPQEIVYNGQSTLDVQLKEDNKQLDEVVVVGYGTQKKVNLTGSVSMVNSEVLESRPVQNVSQALQGVVPGLSFSVNNSGGTLDNQMEFNIRGTGTIGEGSGSSPLVLIDGIEGNMNTINANDIESISVLKDAAASSIYGAKAAFGVILIKTKSGKSGKTNVSYTGNVRFSDAIQLPDMMDSYQFALYFNRAAANNGQGAVFSDEVLQRIQDYQAGKINTVSTPSSDGRWNSYTGSNANTNWFDEMYQDWAPSQEHNLSISGGSEKITYRVSGSYLNQRGLINFGEDRFKRYTTDAKITAVLADWVTMNYNSKWTREDYTRPTYMTGLFFHNIARRWPTCFVYDDNGYLADGMEIIQMQNGGKRNQQNNYYTQQLSFLFEPIKDWKINVEGNMRTYNNNQHWAVLPVYAHDANGEAYGISWDGGADYAVGQTRVYDYRYKEDFFTTNIYTSYTKSIGKNNFTGMIGFNGELTKYDYITGQGDGLVSETTPYLNQTTKQQVVGSSLAENSVAGFFARINYNYDEKYLLELNGRYDGSSRFIGDKRWGFFPSVSAGWNIAREEFFGNLANTISTLKLRGSWGRLGNTDTEDAWYPFYQTMPTGTANGSWLVDSSTRPNTASLPAIVSSSKTWETIESWDVGLDWSIFNNRLIGSFDYFTRYTYDMIANSAPLPAILGASTPKVNNADMKSYGFEFELAWRDRIGKVNYGAKFVLSDAQQKLTRYYNPDGNIDNYYSGKMLNEIWGYTTVGIAQSQEEMDNHLANNKPSWGSNWGAGDIMYADLNGDGKVNNGENTLDDHGDLTVIGNSTPRYNYGITLDASWNGFDFSVFFQGVGKRDYALSGPYFWGASGVGMWQAAAFKEHWDFWRPEGDPLGANTDAYYPRVIFSSGSKNTKTQTRYLQNAAYIRMKNLQFGYTLPKTLVSKAGLSQVRVYISGDNLLTFSDITGIFDPETLGGDWGPGKLYPLTKTISVGLNVNF